MMQAQASSENKIVSENHVTAAQAMPSPSVALPRESRPYLPYIKRINFSLMIITHLSDSYNHTLLEYKVNKLIIKNI